MTVRNKIFFTILFTIFILVIGFLISQKWAETRYLTIVREQKKERNEAFQAIFNMRTNNMRQIITDYTCYDDMVDFTKNRDTTWAKRAITVTETYEIQAVWVVNLENEVIFYDHDKSAEIYLEIPKEVCDILYYKKRIYFFMLSQHGVVEICGATIHKSNDKKRREKPSGYMFIARIWDNLTLSELEKLTNSKISINLDPSFSTLNRQDYTVSWTLRNWRNDPIAEVSAFKENTVLKAVKQLSSYSGIFLTVFILIMISIFTLAFHKFIFKPLKTITFALDTQDFRNIISIIRRKDEFGKIAHLIERFFLQQHDLQQEIEERLLVQEKLSETNRLLEEQNQEIVSQKTTLEHLHTETNKRSKRINESLEYAAHIQTAVLPSEKYINKVFADILKHFILYKPRDVVSGDFYFIEKITTEEANSQNEGYLVISVADCTGHGVPGAFMSMLGVAFLNEIVRRKEINHTHMILEELRKRVIDALKQTIENEENDDGMDIGICVIDLQTNRMQFSGANHSLYLIRNNTSQIIEYKGDRMPIGIYRRKMAFKDKDIIDLQKGDIFYLFSDGYTSQFGEINAENKQNFDNFPYKNIFFDSNSNEHKGKFMNFRFKNLLESICKESLKSQKEILEQTFQLWKGKNPQLDDILIIGIEVE